MLPFRPLPLVLVFGYISITALGETSAPFPSLPSSLHKRGLWDLAKAGRPETARHPRKASDRIRSFISEGERGAIEPAVTVGRGKKRRTHPTCVEIECRSQPPGLSVMACRGLQHPLL